MIIEWSNEINYLGLRPLVRPLVTGVAIAPSARGNIDYDQLKAAARHGIGAQIQMFGGGAITAGHAVIFDAAGNVVDGGASVYAPTSRLISTTAPLTGGGDLTADRTLAINAFTGDSGSGGLKGAVPAPAAGDAAAGKYLKADGTWTTAGGDVTAEYIIGATDAALTNALVWPALYNHVDAPPVSAGSLDDEFDASTLNGAWSWVNQGSATATFSRSWLKLALASSTSSDNITMIVKTAPSTPWEVTARICMVTLNNNWLGGGIVLRESSTGKIMMFGPAFYQTRGLDVSRWNSTTSNSSDTTGGSVWATLGCSPGYMRVKDDGTNLTFSASADGISFAQFNQQSRTAFLSGGANQVGLGYNCQVVGGTGTAIALDCDYFRRTV